MGDIPQLDWYRPKPGVVWDHRAGRRWVIERQPNGAWWLLDRGKPVPWGYGLNGDHPREFTTAKEAKYHAAYIEEAERRGDEAQ